MQLAQSAQAGDKVIFLDRNVDWVSGDEIAIAPTGFYPFEAEKVTVVSIAGNRVSVDPPPIFEHFDDLQNSQGYRVDERAEVGLLALIKVVQRAEDSEISQYGGDGMIMPGSSGRGEAVGFYRMRQMGHSARYPSHGHLIDRFDRPTKNQYVRDCSIHRSFQRAVVIYGTSNVSLRSNAAYDIFNHIYVLAVDGDETGNAGIGNLGILAKILV